MSIIRGWFRECVDDGDEYKAMMKDLNAKMENMIESVMLNNSKIKKFVAKYEKEQMRIEEELNKETDDSDSESDSPKK